MGVGWESIDVTSIVSTWTGMQHTRYGMLLKTPNDQERNTAYEKRFCSADKNNTGSGHCQTERKPELRITYTPQIGDQGWYSQTEHSLNDRTELKINHRSGNAYLHANDAQVNALGLNLTPGRRYNSLADVPGSFGPQWSLSGGPDVWLEKIDQWRYAYHAPDGAEFGPFVRNANASSDTDYRKFTRPAGGVGAELKDTRFLVGGIFAHVTSLLQRRSVWRDHQPGATPSTRRAVRRSWRSTSTTVPETNAVFSTSSCTCTWPGKTCCMPI